MKAIMIRKSCSVDSKETCIAEVEGKVDIFTWPISAKKQED